MIEEIKKFLTAIVCLAVFGVFGTGIIDVSIARDRFITIPEECIERAEKKAIYRAKREAECVHKAKKNAERNARYERLRNLPYALEVARIKVVLAKKIRQHGWMCDRITWTWYYYDRIKIKCKNNNQPRVTRFDINQRGDRYFVKAK